jgi:hypothetical protein
MKKVNKKLPKAQLGLITKAAKALSGAKKVSTAGKAAQASKSLSQLSKAGKVAKGVKSAKDASLTKKSLKYLAEAVGYGGAMGAGVGYGLSRYAQSEKDKANKKIDAEMKKYNEARNKSKKR